MTKYTDADLRDISKKAGYSIADDFGGGATKLPPALSAGEELLALMLSAFNVEPAPEREYRFDERRRWRADFAWPDHKLIVEVEGITFEGGRHQRPAGFEKDCEKYEAAVLQGWTVYRVTHHRIKTGRAITVIKQLLNQHTKV